MPGSYDAVIDFSPPPPGFFENGPLFGDFPELAEEMLERELPGQGVFQSMSLSGSCVAAELTAAAYACSAVQTAVAHQAIDGEGCGIANLCSRDLRLPGFLSTYVETLGEFCGPDERRWMLVDFKSNIKAMARAIEQCDRRLPPETIRSKYWLPCHVDDGRTGAIIAQSLAEFLREKGAHILVEDLMGKVFSGDTPPAFAALSSILTKSEFTSLELVFKRYSTDREFLQRFSSQLGFRALGILGLEWERPSRQDLGFKISPLEVVTNCLNRWCATSPVYADCFGVSFRKLCFRPDGDPTQICRIRDRPGGVTLSSHYAPDPYSATFRACFGSPMVYTSVPLRSTAVGRISVQAQKISLMRDHLGVASF
jgi:hypothetical protein